MTNTDTNTTTHAYRAAYLTDGQAELVLTGPEHARLDDEALLSEARKEMARIGAAATDEMRLVIGYWTP